jgi:hypothetical protein
VTDSNRAALGVALYVALMAAWIYGFAATSHGEGTTAGVIGLLLLAAIHLGAGLVVARWWAVLLPIGAIAVALPAGTPDVGGEPFPIWFSLVLFALPEAALVALGVLVARKRAGNRPTTA